jgi:hypothetical protein
MRIPGCPKYQQTINIKHNNRSLILAAKVRAGDKDTPQGHTAPNE